MKNILIQGLKIFCLTGTILFSSCNESVDYEPASSVVDGGNVYLSISSSSLVFTPDQETSFVVTVHRASSDADQTVSLTSDNPNFNVPSTVQFAAGEDKKDVTVGFNMEVGNTEKLNITVPEEDKYVYGVTDLSLTVTRDYTWSKPVVGALYSSFGGGAWYVNIQQAQEANIYKVVDAYEEGYNFTLTVNEDNSVTVPKQGVISDYGGYGLCSIQGTGVMDGKNIVMDLQFTVSAGSFGVFTERIVLP